MHSRPEHVVTIVAVSLLSILPSFQGELTMSDDERVQQDSPLAEAARDPLRTVLNEIRQSERRMERRLQQLEADVQRGQEEAVEKAAKKARHNRPVAFQCKAHGEQFDFNKRVAECFKRHSRSCQSGQRNPRR